MRRLRIALFCDEFPPKSHGGIGVFVRDAAKLLSAAGHEVSVLEFSNIAEEKIVEGYKIVRLRQCSLSKIGWLVNRFKLWLWAASKAATDSLDVLEVPDYQGWFPFPLHSHRLKIIVRLHMCATVLSHAAKQKVNKRHFICELLNLLSCDHWIAVSNAILADTCKAFHIEPSSVEVIYNPVSVPSPDQLPPGGNKIQKPYICFIGSVSVEKGALVLASACRSVLAKFRDLSLVFVGPYNEKDAVCSPATLYDAAGKENQSRVRFLGRQPRHDALRFVSDSEFVVLPSCSEAFGLACVEAMTLRKAVIFTRLGAGPEIITHGIDGILVEPFDETAVSNAIVELLLHKQKTAEIARRAQISAVARFSSNLWVYRTTNSLESICPACDPAPSI